ncbi:MAG: GSCFA domain-containing protein [Pseudomonadota bacterium]
MSDDHGDAGMISPYRGLDDRAFWRSGVAEAGVFPPPDLYRARFPVTRDMPIFTAGSCFAQHVGRALTDAGFSVIDSETLPPDIPDALARRWGYRMYSARFGNIYTTRQLAQLLDEALGDAEPADPIWQHDGRFFDALRPNVTPGGLETEAHVAESRAYHLEAVRDAAAEAAVVVFTLGLTEAWEHVDTGTVYPTAPGTIAGAYDPARYRFVNFRAAQVRADFLAARDRFRLLNPDVRFLLTVSPVPLTATASGGHVLPASVYSKSVLRTVAGELVEDFDDIDYFPSYEIVAGHPSRGQMFDANLRTVTRQGVARVMAQFLSVHDPAPSPDAQRARQLARARRKADQATASSLGEDALVCEDELLEAFRK